MVAGEGEILRVPAVGQGDLDGLAALATGNKMGTRTRMEGAVSINIPQTKRIRLMMSSTEKVEWAKLLMRLESLVGMFSMARTYRQLGAKFLTQHIGIHLTAALMAVQ